MLKWTEIILHFEDYVTRTPPRINTYMCTYMCVCVCMRSVLYIERESERERIDSSEVYKV